MRMTTDHRVLSIKRHSTQVVAPSTVQCLEKLYNHVEHVLNDVVLEHGDGDQVEVCEIIIVASTHA
jgi:hypothetical protein